MMNSFLKKTLFVALLLGLLTASVVALGDGFYPGPPPSDPTPPTVPNKPRKKDKPDTPDTPSTVVMVDYDTPLGLGQITMNIGDCFE